MKCKDCGREITRTYKGERLCGRCQIGFDLLFKEMAKGKKGRKNERYTN